MATLKDALTGLAAYHGQELSDGLLDDLEKLMKQTYSAAMDSCEVAVITLEVLTGLSKDPKVRSASFGQVADHILRKAEEHTNEQIH